MNEPIPPVPSVPSVPCCSLKNKLICSSAGLVVLIIVGVAGFAFGRNSNRLSSVSQTLPTPTSSFATPTSDTTANWKTYVNKNYKFSLKYPSDWILNSKPEEIISKQGEGLYIIRSNIVPFSFENKMIIVISTYDNPEKFSAIEWLKLAYEKNGLPYVFREKPSLLVNATINGLPAYKDTHEIDEEPDPNSTGKVLPRIFYWVARDNNIYDIQLNNYDPEAFGYKDEVIYATFDQILSTFKFLQ